MQDHNDIPEPNNLAIAIDMVLTVLSLINIYKSDYEYVPSKNDMELFAMLNRNLKNISGSVDYITQCMKLRIKGTHEYDVMRTLVIKSNNVDNP